MGFFKEITCAHCGKRAGMLGRVALDNDQYVCGKCMKDFPTEIQTELAGHSYQDFLRVRHYMDEINPKLKKTFHETHKYYKIHIDTAHDLFYLDDLYPTVYFRFENLKDFSLEYVADTVKDGMLSTKVNGKIFMKIGVEDLLFFRDCVLASDVKANAKVSGVINKKYTYENPKGMDDFLHHFQGAWTHAVTEVLNRYLREREAEEEES